MDTKGLDLPNGGHFDVCHFVDGMREMSVYDIMNDAYRVRWDTMINGEKMTYFKEWPIPCGSVDMVKRKRELMAFIAEHRELAKNEFEQIESKIIAPQ
jgi:hypothetical protein